MTKTEPRRAIDTCVLLNVMTNGGKDDPLWLPRSRRVLEAAVAGKYKLALSAYVIPELAGNGEIRGTQLEKRERHRRITRTREWMSEAGFLIVEIDGTIANHAADLAITKQLRGGDAVILASAIRAKVEVLYTWDTDLLKLNGTYEFEIAEPPTPGDEGQLDIFSAAS
ncbi:PIN domain-containing protein [Paenarthrobacter sp. AR 02]|uniref:type II toxin-antitoxin system VapC family toxin n=1 Tax=Paenarthrobacter sp. AR 02 TaxID=2899821 RepID=UPI001F183AB4|nr:PIN domain-containing protein [Paenarthrobacter sp. AR 02]MCF3137653.1 PIN domain-containing protein [Paenarthrobacter sp. AR 02]